MVYLLYLWIVGKILHHLKCIGNVTLYTKRESLKSLKQNPRIEWRYCCTSVTKDYGTYASNKGSLACHIGKYGSMITWVWLGKCRILVCISLPVECTTVYNHTAEA